MNTSEQEEKVSQHFPVDVLKQQKVVDGNAKFIIKVIIKKLQFAWIFMKSSIKVSTEFEMKI